ncbi:MAG TPA: YCF48-related protein [Chloroflexota bacterium]|nr:YCF48-related protein [Chloroflexota bacterium]
MSLTRISHQLAPVSQVLDLSFVNTHDGWALGSACGAGESCAVAIRKTTDGGRTWHPVVAPVVSPAWHFIAAPTVSPADQGNVDARGSAGYLRFATTRIGWLYGPGLFVTDDGGSSWTRQRSPWATVALAPVGASVWALQEQCASPPSQHCSFRLIVSTDTGHTWHIPAVQPRLSGPQQMQLVRTDAGHAWILTFGGSHATLLATVDGGKHWQARGYPCGPVGSFIDRLAAHDDTHLWLLCGGQPAAGTEFKYLYRSNDGGAHWRRVAKARVPSTATLPLGGYLADLAVTGAARGWLALVRGTLYTTGNGGSTWQPAISFSQANPGVGGLGPLVFVDPAHGWLGAQDRVFRTTDGGTQWHATSLG